MERLLQPSLKEKGNALNVAQIAMLNLETMIKKLQQMRAKCGEQMAADRAECDEIDKTVVDLEARLVKVRTNCDALRAERDAIQKQVRLRAGRRRDTVADDR